MAFAVYTKSYTAPPVNRHEIFRYLGARDDVPEVSALVDECIAEVAGVLSFKVCYFEADVSCDADTLCIGNIRTTSSALKKNLLGCERAVIFAATVGISLDRLIARYSAVSPTKAVILDAIGSERIEALCDKFTEDIASGAVDYALRARFSPGYGDFKIETQREIFELLDCPRKIGLVLNESMLMSPSKSVTAIIGKVREH